MTCATQPQFLQRFTRINLRVCGREAVPTTLEQLRPNLRRSTELLARLDGRLADLQILVDLIDEVEGMAKTCAEGHAPQLAAVCSAASKVLDGLLLDTIADKPRSLETLASALSALDQSLSALADPLALCEILTSPHMALCGLVGVEPPALTAEAIPATQTTSPSPTIDETEEAFTFDDPELLSEFIFESSSHLDSVEADLLELETRPRDVELINSIFRPIHSIKGSAAFIGLTKINHVAHEAETVLDMARGGQLTLTPVHINVLFEAIDLLKQLMTNLAVELERQRGVVVDESSVVPVSIDPILKELRLAQRGESPKAAEPKRLGEILVREGAITAEQLEDAISRQEKPLGEILVELGFATPEKVEEALSKQRTTGGASGSAIKVDTAKLDSLLNAVGELMITHSFFNQNTGGVSDAHTENIQRLGKIVKELQAIAMSMRMVPVKQIFQRMGRLVRDAALRAGKRARLVITGEETELDKSVIELIGDPLVHILRNSVDHGIEPPDERIALGKPEQGEIHLSAAHHGDTICIEIIDDGRGLNRAKIRERAIEQGLVAPDRELTDAQIHAQIFAPGFSTAETVTDISGRGVGLDVVKRNIEKLHGRIDIVSEDGGGTTVRLRVPLTLAVINGMIVQVGTERYIIPLAAVIESLRPERSQLSTVEGRGEIVNLRGDILPLLRLHSVLGVKPNCTDPCDAFVVIAESEGIRVALLVDDLVGQQQVVIKSLGDTFRAVGALSGATILGDGRVGLILDIAGLIEENVK